MSSIRLVARVSRMSVFTASLRPALVRPCVLRTTSAFLPKSHQISALYSRSVWNTALTSRSLSTTPFASQGGPEGPITSELISTMRNKISTALETDMVEVQDMQGDGRHVEIVVVSKLFDGKSAVNRQRMVYKAIWEELQDTVHAVDAMVTRTPEEAGVST